MVGQRKIIVIDDEQDILDLVVPPLQKEGFLVVACLGGQDGLRRVRQERPDLVILDVMLPDLDGIEVCRALKWDEATRDIPIVMVTGKADETDVVLGLGIGADDYISKPFRLKELLARVKAVLRRSGGPSSGPGMPAAGGIAFDDQHTEVKIDGRPVHLTPTEYKLLRAMAASPGQVFTRAELIAAAANDDTEVTERTIDVHVQAIRKKLGPFRALIGTVRGSGYRYEA
jgi:DNA-binding response OmpR family regulator